MNKQSLTTNKHTPKGIYNTILYAYEQSEISSKRKQELILEYRRILNSLVLSYTHECSTSLSEAKFTYLIRSIDYISHHAPIKPIFKHLNTHALQQIYDLGILRLQEDTKQIEHLLYNLQKELYTFQNERYLDVVFHQIPNYVALLKNKDAKFHFHHTKEDLDYPLLDGLSLFANMYHKRGSDFVLEYTKRLSLEQKFCTLFKEEIPPLLQQHVHLRGINPHDIHISLFELVLDQWMANMILFQEAKLSLTKQDCIRLKQLLSNNTFTKRIHDFMLHAIKSIDVNLVPYLAKHKALIQSEWHKFIYTPYNLFIFETTDEDSITFHLEQKNSDVFEIHLATLSDMQNLEDKLSYIKEKQIDIYDMFDLLDHDIFYDAEYTHYFNTLSNMEIGIFFKLLLGEITNLNPTSFTTLLNDFDPENEWQTNFKNYLHSTDEESKEEIFIFTSKLKLI
ncbi:DUF6179 domain-containing protein [Amedibacillus sp. YH-ame10]